MCGEWTFTARAAASLGSSGASADVIHETFALQPLLDSLSGTSAIAAQRRGLAFHPPGSDVAGAVVSGAPVRLNQILTNLLSNAVKFTPQGDIPFRVERKATGDEALYRFTVEDTGPGFSPEIRAKLFSQGATQADEIAAGAGLD